MTEVADTPKFGVLMRTIALVTKDGASEPMAGSRQEMDEWAAAARRDYEENFRPALAAVVYDVVELDEGLTPLVDQPIDFCHGISGKDRAVLWQALGDNAEEARQALCRITHRLYWLDSLVRAMPPGLETLESSLHRFRFDGSEAKGHWYVIVEAAEALLGHLLVQRKIKAPGSGGKYPAG